MHSQNFLQSPKIGAAGKAPSPGVKVHGSKINDGIDQYMFRQQQNMSPP